MHDSLKHRELQITTLDPAHEAEADGWVNVLIEGTNTTAPIYFKESNGHGIRKIKNVSINLIYGHYNERSVKDDLPPTKQVMSVSLKTAFGTMTFTNPPKPWFIHLFNTLTPRE